MNVSQFFQKQHHIAVEAKGSNASLISCLLEEIKCLFSNKEDTLETVDI